MKLRTGKIVCVVKSTKKVMKPKISSSYNKESRLRNGKLFRLEYKPLEWMDMELKYEKYVKNYKNTFGSDKPILATSNKQLNTFKKGITNIISKQKYMTDNEGRLSIVKCCVLWIKENINLFFCPGLICDKVSYQYLFRHVKWMQNQLDGMNDERILEKYNEKDVIQLKNDFDLIHSMWQTL